MSSAGTITGTVTGESGAADAAADGPCAGKAPSASPVVVYLEDIPRGRPLPADAPRRYELATSVCALEPAVSIATAGGTLNVTNALRAVHQVDFVFEGMRNPMMRVHFSDPGQVVPSETVLGVPGLVDVRSDLAPSVRARIVVVEHPYAVQASGGTFRLDSVPPGSYTLVAVGLDRRATTRVDVRPGGETPVTLRLQ